MGFGYHRDPMTKTNRLRAMQPGTVLTIESSEAGKWMGAVANARRSRKLVDHIKCSDWKTHRFSDGSLIITAI